MDEEGAIFLCHLRQERHQKVMLLEVSYAAVVPELFGLLPIASNVAGSCHLGTGHTAGDGVQQSRLA